MPSVLVSLLKRVGEFLYSLATTLNGPGLLLVAVADSSFLTVPEGNDLLIVILSAGNTWKRMVYYVAMTITGSVLGCFLLYTVGRRGGSPLLRSKFSRMRIERVERLFSKYGVLTVIVPSILPPPCPFKVFVLSAGVFRLDPLKFGLAVAIGRTIRYFMWGILAVLYGNPVRLYMQHNLTKVGSILFTAFLLVIVILTATYIYRTKRSKRIPPDV